MDTQNTFNLDNIKTLSQNDAIEYIKKFFIPLTNGDHAMLKQNGKYEIVKDEVIKKTFFKRMSSELNDFYFKQYTSLKTPTYEFGKEKIIGDYLNLCPNLKAQYKHKFEDYDEDTKNKVQIMLNFIKEVLANNNENSYDYLIKWIANMLKGNKNDSCLYLKGQQGIGKSTLFEFLKKYVLGEDLLLETGSNPLKKQFNGILGGKLLVVFEELENFNVSEWACVSSVLKRFITSDTYTLEEKNINSYQTKNINNYVLNSNNDAIKDDDGRRYFILDVSHKYKENHNYFGSIRKNCFNDIVGEAFYSYMINIDVQNFIPQKFPNTEAKLNSFIKRLDKVYEFIKNEFILKNESIKHTAKELYDLYQHFCTQNLCKKVDRNKFWETLKCVGIEYKKSNGNNWCKISIEDLKEIANKNHWIHELDEFEQTEIINNDDAIINENNELKSIIETQKNEIEELKKQLEELRNAKEQNNNTVNNVASNNKPKKIATKKPIKKLVKETKELNNENDNITPDVDLFADF